MKILYQMPAMLLSTFLLKRTEMASTNKFEECSRCVNREFDPFECDDCVDACNFEPYEEDEDIDDSNEEYVEEMTISEFKNFWKGQA